MSQSEYCIANKYNEFIEIKKELKNILQDTFKFFIEDYLENNAVYFGLSIYEKQYENQQIQSSYNDVLYSASIYTNENNRYTISENDFSGFVFDEILEEETIGTKIHKYMNIFFKDIHSDLISNKNIYVIKPIKINDKYILQFYLTFSKTIPNAFKKAIVNKLNEIINNKKKVINCIFNSDIKMIFTKGIIKSNNEIILIIDLIRTEKRTEKKYVNMDSILTSKLIYELKDIAGRTNFKTINHTGDGFIFIYRGEKENISYDISLFIERVSKKMNDFQDFLIGLNNIANLYKVRAIISNCDTLYEMDYVNNVDKKLYFSSYLDMIFDDMNTKIKHYEIECMKNSNIFFLIRNNILEENNNIKQENYTICNIKDNKDLYITGIRAKK